MDRATGLHLCRSDWSSLFLSLVQKLRAWPFFFVTREVKYQRYVCSVLRNFSSLRMSSVESVCIYVLFVASWKEVLYMVTLLVTTSAYWVGRGFQPKIVSIDNLDPFLANSVDCLGMVRKREWWYLKYIIL